MSSWIRRRRITRSEGFLHRPKATPTDALVLTHGAGSNCQSPLLVALAKSFCEAGLIVLRCDLPFPSIAPERAAAQGKRRTRPGGPAGGDCGAAAEDARTNLSRRTFLWRTTGFDAGGGRTRPDRSASAAVISAASAPASGGVANRALSRPPFAGPIRSRDLRWLRLDRGDGGGYSADSGARRCCWQSPAQGTNCLPRGIAPSRLVW